MTVVAVVLAGGESRRFGSDKLAAALDHRTVLDHTLASLPADFAVIVVGPERPTARSVTFTREQPPGGGPAAAMVAGVRAALTMWPELVEGPSTGSGHSPDAVVVLPGDAPEAGHGAVTLLAALAGHEAAVGVDPVGQLQPLQLAMTPTAARRLVDLAGPGGAAGQSARRLVAALDLARVPLDPDHTYDIDTPAALEHWRSDNR